MNSGLRSQLLRRDSVFESSARKDPGQPGWSIRLPCSTRLPGLHMLDCSIVRRVRRPAPPLCQAWLPRPTSASLLSARRNQSRSWPSDRSLSPLFAHMLSQLLCTVNDSYQRLNESRYLSLIVSARERKNGRIILRGARRLPRLPPDSYAKRKSTTKSVMSCAERSAISRHGKWPKQRSISVRASPRPPHPVSP